MEEKQIFGQLWAAVSDALFSVLSSFGILAITCSICKECICDLMIK